MKTRYFFSLFFVFTYLFAQDGNSDVPINRLVFFKEGQSIDKTMLPFSSVDGKWKLIFTNNSLFIGKEVVGGYEKSTFNISVDNPYKLTILRDRLVVYDQSNKVLWEKLFSDSQQPVENKEVEKILGGMAAGFGIAACFIVVGSVGFALSVYMYPGWYGLTELFGVLNGTYSFTGAGLSTQETTATLTRMPGVVGDAFNWLARKTGFDQVNYAGIINNATRVVDWATSKEGIIQIKRAAKLSAFTTFLVSSSIGVASTTVGSYFSVKGINEKTIYDNIKTQIDASKSIGMQIEANFGELMVFEYDPTEEYSDDMSLSKNIWSSYHGLGRRELAQNINNTLPNALYNNFGHTLGDSYCYSHSTQGITSLFMVNNSKTVYSNEVYNIADLINYTNNPTEENKKGPVNNLHDGITVNYFHRPTSKGSLTYHDINDENNILKELGDDECIYTAPQQQVTDYCLVLRENGNIDMVEKYANSERTLWTRTNHTTKCVFPSNGPKNILANQKLIPYDQIPEQNEVNYLLNGNYVNILDHNHQLKVIKKDASGYYDLINAEQGYLLN